MFQGFISYFYKAPVPNRYKLKDPQRESQVARLWRLACTRLCHWREGGRRGACHLSVSGWTELSEVSHSQPGDWPQAFPNFLDYTHSPTFQEGSHRAQYSWRLSHLMSPSLSGARSSPAFRNYYHPLLLPPPPPPRPPPPLISWQKEVVAKGSSTSSQVNHRVTLDFNAPSTT